jgi:dephospho-CoA kinase
MAEIRRWDRAAYKGVMTMKVIGLIGKAGSGKTTAAKYLVSKYGFTWLRFSSSLKLMLSCGLGIPDEYIDGDKKNEPCEQLCGRTVRHAMITLGTEWGRNLIHEDIWVKALERQMCEHLREGRDKFVIDDVRFLSEANWITKIDFGEKRLIKIVRGEAEIIDHVSETEQDKIVVDWHIWNNGTLESLYRSIDELLFFSFKEN